jgi:multicomponent K+:H+ antiporter subunit D
LRRLLAYLLVVSIGTLLTAVGLFSEAGLSAGLVYLVHTTLATAGMFLLADLIARQRASLDHRPAPPVAQPLLLGGLFFVGAVALAGLPPLSGFLGKLMILQAAADSASAAWSWSAILTSSLLSVIALSRMGSALFWHTEPARPSGKTASFWLALPALGLLAASIVLIAAAQPLIAFAGATARQLSDPSAYIEHVLPPPQVTRR